MSEHMPDLDIEDIIQIINDNMLILIDKINKMENDKTKLQEELNIIKNHINKFLGDTTNS